MIFRGVKHRQASVVVLFFPFLLEGTEMPTSRSLVFLPLSLALLGVNSGWIAILPMPFFSAGLKLGAGEGKLQGIRCCCLHSFYIYLTPNDSPGLAPAFTNGLERLLPLPSLASTFDIHQEQGWGRDDPFTTK